MVCCGQVRLLDLVIGLLLIDVGLCVGVVLARLCWMLLAIDLWLIVLDIYFLVWFWFYLCCVGALGVWIVFVAHGLIAFGLR